MDYNFITTFRNDFAIADMFGTKAIKDTFERAFNEWKHDYKYLTELVIVLNWRIFDYYDTNREYAKLYDELWRKADNYAVNNLQGEELSYYYRVTD